MIRSNIDINIGCIFRISTLSHLGNVVALGDRHLLTVHLGDLLAGLGGVGLAAGRRLYLSLCYHWLRVRGVVIVRLRGMVMVIVRLRGIGLDMELHMGIIVEVVKVVVSLVLV